MNSDVSAEPEYKIIPYGEVSGPWNKGDPVHEILTSHTLYKYNSGTYKKNFKKYNKLNVTTHPPPKNKKKT